MPTLLSRVSEPTIHIKTEASNVQMLSVTEKFCVSVIEAFIPTMTVVIV